MKRFLSAALVLSLLGSSAAVAAPYGHGDFGHRGYAGHYDGRGYDRGHGGNGALLAGVGLFALAAILATSSQNDDRGRYDDGRYGPPPRYGYDSYRGY